MSRRTGQYIVVIFDHPQNVAVSIDLFYFMIYVIWISLFLYLSLSLSLPLFLLHRASTTVKKGLYLSAESITVIYIFFQLIFLTCLLASCDFCSLLLTSANIIQTI